MKIVIETIPHDKQRYPTVGDYWIDDDGTMQVRISDLGNPGYEQAVILHELTELFLVLHCGIAIEDIDKFDIAFEAARKEINAEPGDHPDAPYQRQHGYATAVERMFMAAIDASWTHYDKACADADA